jgi:iron(III) transport system permease protein
MIAHRRGGIPWRAGWFLLPVVVPLLAVFAALSQSVDIWPHLLEYVLPRVVVNTAWLVAGVALGAGIIGVLLAGLVALTDFPGRRQLEWALLLPLAAPGYVLAFVYIGLFDVSGPVQQALLANGWLDDGIAVRGRGGVTLVLILTLYPYVYLLARGAFRSQGSRAIEAAQSLGYSRVQAFFRAAVPLARPWLAGGIGLVVMETLADFGTVAAFNYDTFTTAIYKTWFSLFSFDGALQLSAVLATVVLFVLVIEQELRSRRAYTTDARNAPAPRLPLRGMRAWLATIFCVLVLIAAFILPMIQLLVWSVAVYPAELTARYFDYFGRSLMLAGGAALLITLIALLFGYTLRGTRGFGARLVTRIATLGYALPGPVLAVGFFAAMTALSGGLTIVSRALFGEGAMEWHLQGTLAVLFAAYVARFLAVGFNPVESAFGRLSLNLDEAARGLGASRSRLLGDIHLPLLRNGLLTGAVLAFVDVLKDMPITLMLRPFGWETLAVRVFELTSEGEYARAALPSIAIVLAGLIPVLILVRRSDHAA